MFADLDWYFEDKDDQGIWVPKSGHTIQLGQAWHTIDVWGIQFLDKPDYVCIYILYIYPHYMLDLTIIYCWLSISQYLYNSIIYIITYIKHNWHSILAWLMVLQSWDSLCFMERTTFHGLKRTYVFNRTVRKEHMQNTSFGTNPV